MHPNARWIGKDHYIHTAKTNDSCHCQPNHLDLSDGFLDHVLFGPLLPAPRVLVHLDRAQEREAEHCSRGGVHPGVRTVAAPLWDTPANLLCTIPLALTYVSYSVCFALLYWCIVPISNITIFYFKYVKIPSCYQTCL